MNLSYRTRRNLQNFGIFVLILLLLAVVVWAVWMLWLDRYVVYTSDGAKLNFNLSVEDLSGESAVSPNTAETVSIYYNEGENAVNTSTDLTQVTGYYIDSDMLAKEIDLVLEQVQLLPNGTPVMIDMKDAKGCFYYITTLSSHNPSGVDLDTVTDLLRLLKKKDCYLIARVSAFRDYFYGLENVSHGLFHRSRQYLWQDSGRCYWLNPSSEGTLVYLMQTATEIKALGFDELVFGNFYFPDTSDIYFTGDKASAIANAANRLVETCGSENFCISFVSNTPDFSLPAGRTRLYLENQSASAVNSLAQAATVPDKTVNLVFLTEVNDTRFDAYGVLRPITAAQLEQ
ncbi:MAG: hypothetical protein IJB17_05430 [Oscillospiraceae bacterium]|nr:hypothetical protein [Oscillospiraceae bacterium]